MSDFVDRLETQLLDAARQQAARRRSPHRWLRSRTSRQVAFVLATIVVAAPAIAATQPEPYPRKRRRSRAHGDASPAVG